MSSLRETDNKACIVHAYHGLAAYSSGRSVFELLSKADHLNRLDEEEICVADRPIGAIGVVVAGELTRLFSCDVWSEVAEDGTRRADEEFVEFSMEFPTEEGFHRFCIASLYGNAIEGIHRRVNWEVMDALIDGGFQAAVKKIQDLKNFWDPELIKNSRHYCEGWMAGSRITGVWVKSWADDKIKKIARILARRYNVRVFVVEGTTRIWEKYNFGDWELNDAIAELSGEPIIPDWQYEYAEKFYK